MAAADTPSFWSQPVAAARAYFSRTSTPHAVEWTLNGAMAVTVPYLLWCGDMAALQVYTGLYLAANGLAFRQRRRLERPDEPVGSIWRPLGGGAAVIVIALLTEWIR